MNRTLAYLNLAGILILAGICVAQWRLNREVNLESARLEKVRQDQAARLDEQERTIGGLKTDLEDFRGRLIHANVALKDVEGKSATLDRAVAQLTLERDQLKESVTNWAAAVEARDEHLKLANERLQTLAADRNESVTKFNELAGRYNKVVNDLNQRTQDYNSLVEKYNTLAKEAGERSK